MRTMKLGLSDIEVTRLCYGAWGIGGGTAWGASDDELSIRTVQMAIDEGITFIDTAPVYGLGHSEELLAKALKGRRHRVVLQSKCALNWREETPQFEYTRDGKSVYRNLSAEAVRLDVEDCLSRLETDYLDLCVVHRQSELTPVAETMGALMDLKKEGKIRGVGISNASPEILEEYLKYGPVELAQEQYSLLNAESRSAYLALTKERGVTFQGFSSLARGLLTGGVTMETTFGEGDSRNNFPWFHPEKRRRVLDMLDSWRPLCERYGCSLSGLALAWVLKSGEHVNIIFGSRRPETLLDSIGSDAVALSDEDFSRMTGDAARLG